MSRIDQRDAKRNRVGKGVVLDVGGDKGVAAQLRHARKLPRAGAAAHGDGPDFPPAVGITQARTVQRLPDKARKVRGTLRRDASAPQQAVGPALRVRPLRVYDGNLRQPQSCGKTVVHAARCLVQIGVSIQGGNAVLDQKQQIAPLRRSVVYRRKLPDCRMVRYEKLRTQRLCLLTSCGKGVKRHQNACDRRICPAAQQADMVPALLHVFRRERLQKVMDFPNRSHCSSSFPAPRPVRFRKKSFLGRPKGRRFFEYPRR